MCEWKPDFESLNSRVDAIDMRLTQVEHDVGQMRSEIQDGFKAINESLSNLAHDFGARMNNLDKRIIEEKQEWGKTLRRIALWTASIVLAGCAVAMGVTAYKSLMGVT